MAKKKDKDITIERDVGGRPTKYKPEYCQQIIDYFDKIPQYTTYKESYYADGTLKSKEPIILPEQFPTFQGFAHSIDVNMSQLTRWQEEHQDFCTAYAHAKSLQERIWAVNAMGNLYNSQFAQFFGKNCLGYKDKQEVDIGNSGNAFEVNIKVVE